MEASGSSAIVPTNTEHLTSILSTEPRLDQANLPPTAVDRRIYTPLQDARRQIRLLEWRADSDPAGVHDLQTSVWDIDTAPAYIAISYTWGPTVNRPIIIDGISTSVRHNAYYALWQIRQLQPHCYVWIDSICINQQDDEEKSAQVAIIFQIFQTALRVIACLGEHADDSDFFFATAKAMEPHFLAESRAIRKDSSDDENWLILEKHLDASALRRFISACFRFCCRAYWRRLWIAQELAAARQDVSFAAGVQTLDSMLLYMLYTALCYARMKWDLGCNLTGLDIGAMRSNMSTILIKAFSTMHPRGLGEELGFSVFMLCADVRDRLFGILSMTSWSSTGCMPITPDYTKSAWQLAVMLTRILNVYDLRTGLLALEINCQHEGIRTAVQHQRDQALASNFEDVNQSSVPLKHEEFTLFADCARLYYSGDGSLAADLYRFPELPYHIEMTS